MKKAVILVVTLFAAAAASAQVSVGIKAGVGIAQERFSVSAFSPSVSPGAKVGFYAGPAFTFGKGVVSLQAELTYNLEGTRFGMKDLELNFEGILDDILAGFPELDPGELPTSGTLNGAIAIHYHNLRLPLMVKIKPAGGFSILAGPYLSYRVAVGASASDDLKTGLQFADMYDETMKEIRTGVGNAIRAFDVGVALGIEYQTELGVFFEARYNLGLLNRINKNYLEIDGSGSGTPCNKYSAVQIGMGIRF